MANPHPSCSFADLPPEERRRVASKGGKSVHARGHAPKITHEQRVAMGRNGARATRHLKAGMTPAKVRQMRKLRAEGWTFSRLAKRFGMTANAAWHICHRKTWADVEQLPTRDAE